MREKKQQLLLFCSLFIRMIISISLQTNNQFFSIELIHFFLKNYYKLYLPRDATFRFLEIHWGFIKMFTLKCFVALQQKCSTHLSIIIEFSSFLNVRSIYQSICHIAFEPNQKWWNRNTYFNNLINFLWYFAWNFNWNSVINLIVIKEEMGYWILKNAW